MRKIRVLDLFSGIGGFSLALRGGVFRTVAYCEIDDFCKQVLIKNMSRGFLDRAHVFTDVTTLTGGELKQLSPDMICAGFPCQDVSNLNRGGKGLQGSRSGLFFDIMRICDECPSIHLLFLENSSNIRNRGLDVVRMELRKRGFRMAHVVQSAGACGAPHRRTRWFAVAARGVDDDDINNILSQLVIKNNKILWHDWSKEPCDRVIPWSTSTHTKEDIRRRCSRLGNAVVPSAVVRAWNTLCSGATFACPSSLVSVKKELRLSPTYTTHNFPTPTNQTWHPCRRFTFRCTRMIGNFLYTEKDTYLQVKKLKRLGKISHVPDKFHLDTVVAINPNFVEWLMGFPQDWTKVG